MKRKIFSALCAFLLTVPAMHAQWVVADPGNLAQGIVNSVNEMVETSETAQNAMSTFKEASKIYEQSRKYYDMLKSVNSLVSGSLKVKESVLMLSEISESYVTNYGKMLTDGNYTQRELDAIAFGCPAMGSEELEYDEFQPMWDEVKETLGDKKVVLFGSYSWAEGEWMDNWKADADEEGVNVVDSVICYDAPDDESEAACRALGAELA